MTDLNDEGGNDSTCQIQLFRHGHVWFLSLFLSLAAGLYPAWKASRLSPLEALRR